MEQCSVEFIKANANNFESRLHIKKNGPPRPELQLSQECSLKSKKFKRVFKTDQYNKTSWLCGCNKLNALFCFPCLIFACDSNETNKEWTTTGVTDLSHLSTKIKKHALSQHHMKNEIQLSNIGNIDVRQLLDSGYRKSIREFNEQISKNRNILSRLVDCVKFCGVFELALRGPDQTIDNLNHGVYRGLVDLVAEIDVTMKQHLEGNNVFKGTSKQIQNDLLDTILVVCQEEIKNQISMARFVAIQADETTDVSSQQKLVLILRYEKDCNIHERFWKFLNPSSNSAGDIAALIKQELQELGITSHQLVSQSYDGTAVMSGKLGSVQSIIKSDFPYAFFVHSFSHQFYFILQKSVSINRNISNFFANVQAFPSFFSRSPKRIAVLNNSIKKRNPAAPTRKWNFKLRTIATIYENKEDLKDCLNCILDSVESDYDTINHAQMLSSYLNNEQFKYWLTFFARFMPHCEILFKQFQSRALDTAQVNSFVNNFEQAVTKSCVSPPSECGPNTTFSAQIKEVCDTFITQTKDRFEFTTHLLASKLFCSEKFGEYDKTFPVTDFDSVTATYDFIDEVKLKNELCVIYSREDFRVASSCLAILQLFVDRNLTECFSETVLLLKLICTIPMTTVESERCFSTIKRVKTFLRNMVGQERLNALCMLSMEKELIAGIPDFNNRVIDVFAQAKNRRIDLLFKTGVYIMHVSSNKFYQKILRFIST